MALDSKLLYQNHWSWVSFCWKKEFLRTTYALTINLSSTCCVLSGPPCICLLGAACSELKLPSFSSLQTPPPPPQKKKKKKKKHTKKHTQKNTSFEQLYSLRNKKGETFWGNCIWRRVRTWGCKRGSNTWIRFFFFFFFFGGGGGLSERLVMYPYVSRVWGNWLNFLFNVFILCSSYCYAAPDHS